MDIKDILLAVLSILLVSSHWVKAKRERKVRKLRAQAKATLGILRGE